MTDTLTISSVTIPEKRNRRLYELSYIRSLFDSIAHRYDFLNHALSLGVDILWRRKAVRLLKPFRPKQILDVATGTADLAIEAARLSPDRIVGIDVSPKMVDIGQAKVRTKKLENIIKLETGQAELLHFDTGSFDAVTAAFGVRNFENLEKGLAEIYRVLRDGGVALILEFSMPRHFPVRQLYRIYSKYLLPFLGGLVSKNRSAYEYLPSTVADFPDGEEFCAIMHSAGFSTVRRYSYTFGIASVYLALKKQTTK